MGRASQDKMMITRSMTKKRARINEAQMMIIYLMMTNQTDCEEFDELIDYLKDNNVMMFASNR